MRTRTVAHILLLRLMRKHAGMRLYLNFFKNFIININLAYQGTGFADNFIKDKARDKARDKA